MLRVCNTLPHPSRPAGDPPSPQVGEEQEAHTGPFFSLSGRRWPEGPDEGDIVMNTNALAPYRRITIKIGSALLVDKSGKLRKTWLDDLAEDIATLKSEGRDIVVVSSGAIALGRGLLGLSALSLTLEQSQAAASAGQIALSQAWAEALERPGTVRGSETGQIGPGGRGQGRWRPKIRRRCRGLRI